MIPQVHSPAAVPPRAAGRATVRAVLERVLPAGALVVLYMILERVLHASGLLPAAHYEQPVLFIEAGRHLLGRPLLLGLLLVGGGFLGLRYRVHRLRWEELGADEGRSLRLLVVLCAFLLAWTYATYPFNFYFDRGHYVDRLLLVVLLPAIYWRPVFVFPFLFVFFPIIHQFSLPIGGFAWTIPILPARVLILFAAAIILHLLTGRSQAVPFVFVLCCLIASNYWVSGLGKLELGWVARDRISYMLPATYANGWLGFLEPDALAAWTRLLARFDVPMKAGTLLVECGALVCLWRQATLRFFLVAAVAFHVGVFVVSGICFWMWIVLDVVVLVLFLWKRGRVNLPIFTRSYFLLSVVLIAGSPFWLKPMELAWLDARVTYTYRLEATGASGRTYSLPPRSFAPYDYVFTLGNFRYLVPEPRLRITWGASHQPAVVDRLATATTPAHIWSLERALGETAFDASRRAAFDDFIRRFVGHRNARHTARPWWRWLQAPPSLWTFARADGFDGSESLEKVIVYEVTSLYDDSEYREIRRTPVREIPLAPFAPRAGAQSGTGSARPPN